MKNYKEKFISELSSNFCRDYNGTNAQLRPEPITLHSYKLVWHTLSILLNKIDPASKLEHWITNTVNYCFLPTSANTEKTPSCALTSACARDHSHQATNLWTKLCQVQLHLSHSASHHHPSSLPPLQQSLSFLEKTPSRQGKGLLNQDLTRWYRQHDP